MESLFVPYEIALALKELGFDEPCFGSWETEHAEVPKYTHSISEFYKNSNHPLGKTTAPTFSQAFRWFREKYGLHRHICYFEDTHFWHGDLYRLKDSGLMNYPMELTGYKTYEEAELACLSKLIEIVKNLK